MDEDASDAFILIQTYAELTEKIEGKTIEELAHSEDYHMYLEVDNQLGNYVLSGDELRYLALEFKQHLGPYLEIEQELNEKIEELYQLLGDRKGDIIDEIKRILGPRKRNTVDIEERVRDDLKPSISTRLNITSSNPSTPKKKENTDSPDIDDDIPF
jgi:hypothetical protein